MGVRVAGDPAAFAHRMRALAVELDIALRLDDMRPLDELVWRQEVPQVVVSGA